MQIISEISDTFNKIERVSVKLFKIKAKIILCYKLRRMVVVVVVTKTTKLFNSLFDRKLFLIGNVNGLPFFRVGGNCFDKTFDGNCFDYDYVKIDNSIVLRKNQ